MSPRAPAIESKDLARVARRLGFELRRQKGSHAVFVRAEDGARIVIPMHRGKVIKPKTLAGIVHDMGLTMEEFRELL
ncbi:MAG: addiction module toxin, HicA family [Nitrospirae bacterium]|nr:MAG: addiction module toxin, HicA family [Nitrospirota bacterium]